MESGVLAFRHGPAVRPARKIPNAELSLIPTQYDATPTLTPKHSNAYVGMLNGLSQLLQCHAYHL